MAATSDPLIHTILLGVFGFAFAVMDSNPFTRIEELSSCRPMTPRAVTSLVVPPLPSLASRIAKC